MAFSRLTSGKGWLGTSGARGLAVLVTAACAHLASCNEVAGIRPVQICEEDADCALEPGCGACNQGVCAFVADREPAPAQSLGDCKVRQCDGRGGVREGVPDLEDIPVDSNPCTEKLCAGGQPTVTALDVALDCYTGPPGLEGIGACAPGQQQCVAGALQPLCAGSVLPRIERCGVDQGDLDCDGKALESADGEDDCCGDGVVGPTEECDDANLDENDGCSSGCKIQEVLAITTGGNHTCALLTGGLVKCWGTNNSGQIAQPYMVTAVGLIPEDMGANLLPVDLGDGQSVLAFDAGGAHTCVLLPGGVKCWGSNSNGQLGAGVDSATLNMPAELGFVNLGSGAKVIAIDAGGDQSCAILEDRSLRCWGANEQGQLGIESDKPRGQSPGGMGDALPAVMLGEGAEVQAVSCGTFHTCALLVDGSVKCWGRNVEGELGVQLDKAADPQGDASGEMAELPVVLLDSKATAISAGRYHSCALLDDGRVQCWGRNADGELGQGSVTDTATALAVAPSQEGGSGEKKAIALSAGGRIVTNAQMISYGHTCALLEDQSMKCWGSGVVGQLGRASKNNYGKTAGQTLTALGTIPLAAGEAVKVVSAGGRHTCALYEGGTMRCWGENATGQLGQGQNKDADYSDQAGEQVKDLPPVNLFGPPLP